MDGSSECPTVYPWFVEHEWHEVTEAEAKVHVRPKPPTGMKLTGEFRKPATDEEYLSAGARYVIRRGSEPFDGGKWGNKRWILEDDDTCPHCKGTGRVQT
ncbi:MAG: hypothetical protein JRD89_15690 [Deltaproteobacteria bacterium]|nr:hypothetical protein [Deltaproteobacteria bacterium]